MSITPPVERLNAILTRHDIVMATLNAGPDPEAFVALSRELAELDPWWPRSGTTRPRRRTCAASRP
jgi:hypothetical protein